MNIAFVNKKFIFKIGGRKEGYAEIGRYGWDARRNDGSR